MRFRHGLYVAMLAGSALPVIALAQEDVIFSGIPVHTMDASGAPTYSSRTEGRPYDVVTNLNTTGLFAFLAESNGKHILEDIGFVPGPWASAAVRQITKLDFSVWGNSAGPFKVRIRVYDEDDVNFAGGYPTLHVPSGQIVDGMINPAAVPLHDESFGPYEFIGEGFTIFNNVLSGGGIAVPAADSSVWLEAQIVEVDGVTPRLIGPGAFFFANNSGRAGVSNAYTSYVNVALPGFTEVSYGRDHDLDGIFEGAAAPSAGTPAAPTPPDPSRPDRRYLVDGTFHFYGYATAVHGDIVATAPGCESVALGGDGVWVSDTETLATNGVKWYCITLPSDATDANYKYVDIDTTGFGDVMLALFDSSGILIATDDEGGGAGNALLSFGMGRRAAEGGGAYDGHNFKASSRGLPAGGPNPASPHDAGLPAGTYYLAVAAASNGASFGDGFSGTGNGAGSTVTTRVRTNVSGGTNGPSDMPTATRIVGVTLEDPMVSPGGESAADALYSPGVNWYDFQLCRDADATNQVDISVITTNAPGFSVYVFNDAGNLVGSAFGYRPGTNSTISFGGSNPGLPAGRYFAATAYEYDNGQSDVDVAPSATTNGRWHIRGIMNDGGYDLKVSIAVPWLDCPAVGCTVTCDYNDDGGGDNADVTDLANAIASDTDPFPNHCKDFNQDGGADNSDVTDMADAIAGGTCP